MPRITSGTIRIYTFKEGMLSAVAHDLRLTLKRFRANVDGDRVDAVFFAETIVCDGVIKGGRLDERALSAKDKDKVRSHMQGDVLQTSRYAHVTFEGKGRRNDGSLVVEGQLKLVGKERPIALELTEAEGELRGSVELVPSQWGIKPFSALAGTIRVQDRVRVEVAFPAPAG